MKLNRYITFLAVAAFLLANSALSLADDEIRSFSLKIDRPADDFEDVTGESEEFVGRIKQELNLSKTDFKQLLNTLSDTKTRLEQVKEEKVTLQQQLENIDFQVNSTTNKLVDVIKQIIEKENEITLLYDEIDVRGVAVEYQKQLLGDYLRVMYQEENIYFSVAQDGSVNAMKLLLADGSVNEILRDLDYLSLLNETGTQMLDKLLSLMKELGGKQKHLNVKKGELEVLKDGLALEKQQLEMKKESKEQLMRLTLGQETIYTQLAEQTVAEQEQLVSDIKALGNAVAFIERKMEEEGENFDPSKYKALLDYKTQVLFDFKLGNLELGRDGFTWPVDPDRGISAYFRDPSYVGVFGVQHNAVDIPEYQGSPVRAAADAVVYTARDNGYGYNYVILAHGGGFTTVYGHLSSILVDEGQTVARGSIIGLSGGMPGTLGAGYMTTGPHLHFEMRLNGLYVDPLGYLPLEVLTEDQTERLPEKFKRKWEELKFKSLIEPIERF